MPLPMSHHHTHRFCPLTSNVRSRTDHAPMCVNVSYLHTYIYYIHIHIYIHTYIHTYMYVCIYVHENMYVCMYMCMYMYIHMYVHIHTPINRYEWYICTQIHVIWHARARVCTLYADVWKHKGTHIRWCDIVCKMMWHSMYGNTKAHTRKKHGAYDTHTQTDTRKHRPVGKRRLKRRDLSVAEDLDARFMPGRIDALLHKIFVFEKLFIYVSMSISM